MNCVRRKLLSRGVVFPRRGSVLEPRSFCKTYIRTVDTRNSFRTTVVLTGFNGIVQGFLVLISLQVLFVFGAILTFLLPKSCILR